MISPLVLITVTMSTILITPIVLLFVIETDARWRQFIIATAAIGAIGCLITIVLWIIRPQILMKWRRRRLNTNRHNHQIIDREHTETVMKMLSGIPYLIQAIHYSMETNYYNDMMVGKLHTSVIHSAPACQSTIDDDSNSENEFPAGPRICTTTGNTPRHSGPDEQWLQSSADTGGGASSIGIWSNPLLRLDVQHQPRRQSSSSSSTYLDVFPLSETTLHNNNNMDTISIEPIGDGTGEHRHKSSSVGAIITGTSPALEFRCIGGVHKWQSKLT